MTQPLNRVRQNEKNRHKNRLCKRALRMVDLIIVASLNASLKRYFEFSQTSTSVSITYGNINVYKITRRKLKRGNSLLYRGGNSPYRSRWRMRWRIMA